MEENEIMFERDQSNLSHSKRFDNYLRITEQDSRLTELVSFSCYKGQRVLIELLDGTVAAIVPLEDVDSLEDIEQ